MDKDKIVYESELEWKVNTPSFLKEMLNNTGAHALRIPIQIFANILAEVATRASELNDPKLNHLMSRLALYEECDPYSGLYNQELVDELKKKAQMSK